MTRPKLPSRAPARAWLEASQLKQIPIRRVLIAYQLLAGLEPDGPTLKGPSPFSLEGRLAVNEEKNVWNDSRGRPLVEGRTVPGNVIGLVQALEQVGFRRALEILHERFQIENVTSPTPATLNPTGHLPQPPAQLQASTTPSPSNTPFGRRLAGLKHEVPFLAQHGLNASVAQTLGIGWCSRGLFKGRLVFPICQADQTVMAYVGLDPSSPAGQDAWRFPAGFARSQELYGVGQLHHEPQRQHWAKAHGVVLASDPLEAAKLLSLGFCGGPWLAVVSPMGAELSEAQVGALLHPTLNPSARLTLCPSPYRRSWARQLIARCWLRFMAPQALQEDLLNF